MSRQQNIAIDIPVIIGFIVLTILLACAQILIIPSSKQSDPAIANGDLVTHYIGNVAMELPDSWNMQRVALTFFLGDQRTGPRIDFAEIPMDTSKDVAEKWEKSLKMTGEINKSTDVQTVAFGITDLMDIIGRPAWIRIEEAYELHSSYGVRSAGGSNIKPLKISLELVVPQAVLRFSYQEDIRWPPNSELADREKSAFVADRQKQLINWVLDFMADFQPVDSDHSQLGRFFPTRYGQIELGNKRLYPYYEVEIMFHKKFPSRDRLRLRLYSLPPQRPTCSITNRTVDGHLGYETQYTNDTWYPKKSVTTDLIWTDCSVGPFSRNNPVYDIAYKHYSPVIDGVERAPDLAVWDIVLDSIRAVSKTK